MTFQTVALTITIIAFGAAQYILCFQALRDVRRRVRVRGNNRATWALVILCLPIVGPFMYNWMGPTSFRHRPVSSGHDHSDSARSNITPISAAPSVRNRPGAAAWPDQGTTRGATSGRPSGNRTGS